MFFQTPLAWRCQCFPWLRPGQRFRLFIDSISAHPREQVSLWERPGAIMSCFCHSGNAWAPSPVSQLLSLGADSAPFHSDLKDGTLRDTLWSRGWESRCEGTCPGLFCGHLDGKAVAEGVSVDRPSFREHSCSVFLWKNQRSWKHTTYILYMKHHDCIFSSLYAHITVCVYGDKQGYHCCTHRASEGGEWISVW